MKETIRSCLVAGGSGEVARLFVPHLREAGIEVTTVDVVVADQDLTGDIGNPDAALRRVIESVDLVLLAVPEPVALAAVPSLAMTMGRGALLADTLSVKTRIHEVVTSSAHGIEALSLNPMFAPSLGFAGRPVAAVSLVPGPLGEELLRLVAGWGANVVRVSAGEHDRLTAALQVATHSAVLAFGRSLRELEVDVAQLSTLAPPPHLTLLALLARIASGVPEVYWDIQSANPRASAARDALRAGIDQLDHLVEAGAEAAFAEVLGELRSFLGESRQPLAALCAELFAGLRLPERDQ